MNKRSGKPGKAPKNVRVRNGTPPPRPAGSTNAVFLVGFMGAGKSTVGRVLAQKLNWLFEDLDERIERREGQTVPQMFRTLGEPAFRLAETAALQEVLHEMQGGVARVVALGGGAFAQDVNLQLIEAAQVPTIFLDAPIEELWRRCCVQASEIGAGRPLLQSVEHFGKLYQARHSSYSRASHTIATHGKTVDRIANDIARKLKLKKIAIRTEEGDVE